MLPPELQETLFEVVASFWASTLHKCPHKEPGGFKLNETRMPGYF